MGHIHALLVRAYVVLLVPLLLSLLRPPPERERGDVPGWVMITVMSAGIVGMLTLAARPQLSSMLTNALNSVK